jgi:hypothetical protein
MRVLTDFGLSTFAFLPGTSIFLDVAWGEDLGLTFFLLLVALFLDAVEGHTFFGGALFG